MTKQCSKYPHGKHPNSLKALKKNQYPKGQSGNPIGAPRLKLSKKETREKKLARMAYDRKRGKLLVDSLHDRYIKQLLTSGNNLSLKDIPQWLIEAKREELQLKRTIRKEHDER